MFHARDCKTGSLFDKWANMGPKRRKLLDDSCSWFARSSTNRLRTWFPPDFGRQRQCDFLRGHHQGSGAILALSFNRSVLVPAIGSITELQKLVGSEWVKSFQGTLSPEILNQGFLWTAGIGKIPEAPLECLGWKSIAEKTKAFFEFLWGR